jgi:hypothetical protein
MLMMRTKPGLTLASVRPSMKRLVAMQAKFVHAGVVIRMPPHSRVEQARNFPRGSLCIAYPAGYWAIR